MYAEPEDLRVFCGYDEDDTEAIPDEKALDALVYAQGIIDDFCNTTFADPREDEPEPETGKVDLVYLFDGNGSSSLLAPSAGPFNVISAIEYRSGSDWAEHTGDWWLKSAGEILVIDSTFTAGHQNWRVTGGCWTELAEPKAAMLKRATLLIARLAAVPRDEPLGPSVRQISMEGVSYSYQLSDQAHPTGIDEADHVLRSLRRSVLTT